MRKLSDQLITLAHRTRPTEDTVDAARASHPATLAAKRLVLMAAASAGTGAARSHAVTGRSHTDRTWAAAHDAGLLWGATICANEEPRHAPHVVTTSRHADRAEQDASDAVDLALYVLDHAERALVNAAIARATVNHLRDAR